MFFKTKGSMAKKCQSLTLPKWSRPVAGGVEISEVEIREKFIRQALLSYQFRFRW
jgi:hypothetical protein